jgi:hypothetical protein
MTTGLDPILCSNILQNRACKAVIIPVGLAPQDADHESPCSYCRTWVIQCDTVKGAVKPLVRDAHRSGPQYLACSISKAKHTRLGYRTKLSRLCCLDLPLAPTVPRGGHLVERTPNKSWTIGPHAECRYLKQDPPMTGLHNLYQQQAM